MTDGKIKNDIRKMSMKTAVFIISLIGMLLSIFLQIPEGQINSLSYSIGEISLHDGPSDPEIGLISIFLFAFSLGWSLPMKKEKNGT